VFSVALWLKNLISVYLRLSRSNVRFPGVSRTINHQELAEVIGTGFICGSISSWFSSAFIGG